MSCTPVMCEPASVADELGDIEELALCSCCKRTFDETSRAPKLLACKHHFCLSCARGVLAAGGDVCCMHCWRRTAAPRARPELLPTHAPVLALAARLQPPRCAEHGLPRLWCVRCAARACRACPAPDPHTHLLRAPHEARDLLAREAQELRDDLARLAARHRELQLRALHAATALKLRLEAELAAPPPRTAPGPASLSAATAERFRLRALHAEAQVQARLDDLVRTATQPLDFDALRRALAGLALEGPGPAPDGRDPSLLLANYCAAQTFLRRAASVEAEAEAAACSSGESGSEAASPALRGPSAYPLYYFELELGGAPCGRVVVEVRDDVAPRMARNFAALASGELGVGYRGCAVFQCWESESVITGDFELNNGRGGRSAFEESFFMPDDTRLAALRGSVGMRRSQKRHDNLGLVGSQFRIVLREMRGFTAIFAHVAEGLELVDRLSRTGDSAGKPHSTILITDCGKLN